MTQVARVLISNLMSRFFTVFCNPQGCATVAGGRSAAKTSGAGEQFGTHPEGVSQTWCTDPCLINTLLFVARSRNRHDAVRSVDAGAETYVERTQVIKAK